MNTKAPAQEPQSVASLVAELRNLKMFHTRFERALYEKAAALLATLAPVANAAEMYQNGDVDAEVLNAWWHELKKARANLHKTLADLGMKL